MEELMELLEEIQPDADFEKCDTLIDDGILHSFAILSIVSELQDTYEITITPADIIPENFNSAKALWDMVCRLKGWGLQVCKFAWLGDWMREKWEIPFDWLGAGWAVFFCVGISEENGMYYIALYWTQEGRVEDALSAGSDAEGGKF